MNPLDLIKLTALMEQSSGNPEVMIGLIDGPVLTKHPDLAGKKLSDITENNSATCTQANNTACLHGTFVAGFSLPADISHVKQGMVKLPASLLTRDGPARF